MYEIYNEERYEKEIAELEEYLSTVLIDEEDFQEELSQLKSEKISQEEKKWQARDIEKHLRYLNRRHDYLVKKLDELKSKYQKYQEFYKV